MMNKKIVLIGAGSSSFGPPTLSDLFQSDVFEGSTIMLHDIDEEKLNLVYDIVCKENEIKENNFQIEKTIHRSKAIKNADFVICSIENGDRFELRWQDNTIPHKHGSTEMMAENGGPGGFFHSARQIPEIVQIAKEVVKENPHAFFINYSNPMSRICLAIKRAVPELNFVGLCHQINLIYKDLPYIVNDELRGNNLEKLSSLKKIKKHQETLENIKITVGGLNHFAFIMDMVDLCTEKNLMAKFNQRLMDYYEGDWDRFKYADLTFEVYKRFGWFPYVGDNHLAEYLQIASEYTKYQDFRDWIKRMEDGKIGMDKRYERYHKRLKKGRYPRKGMLKGDSGERAIAILEAIVKDSDMYETAVNIPNNGIIKNLPEDLVIECSGIVNNKGITGVPLGEIPKNIAALLRIEASIQDICVEAILKESKELAIACIATDVNCGSFEMADAIFEEMYELQKEYLPNFK